MQTLEKLSEEYEKAIINRQLEILKYCARGNKDYKFTEDNYPPPSITFNEEPPFNRITEFAPHWNPDLRKLAKALLRNYKLGLKLPLTKEIPLAIEIFVIDKRGIIRTDLYISDKGINCFYKSYHIYDTLAPLLKNPNNERLELGCISGGKTGVGS